MTSKLLDKEVEEEIETTEDEDVLLSVQGSFFILKKSDITEHEWIISKIFSSQVPFKKRNNSTIFHFPI